MNSLVVWPRPERGSYESTMHRMEQEPQYQALEV